jgi:hypothetical protein
VSHVVFPENMGPMANSKYPGMPNDKAKVASKLRIIFYSSIFFLKHATMVCEFANINIKPRGHN